MRAVQFRYVTLADCYPSELFSTQAPAVFGREAQRSASWDLNATALMAATPGGGGGGVPVAVAVGGGSFVLSLGLLSLCPSFFLNVHVVECPRFPLLWLVR